MIILAAWLSSLLRRPAARAPFRTVSMSLHGRPLTFSGAGLAAMMAEAEAGAA